MKSHTEILTALAAAWERFSSWFGRSQAEQAAEQDEEIQAMDKEIQGMEGTRTTQTKEPNDGHN